MGVSADVSVQRVDAFLGVQNQQRHVRALQVLARLDDAELFRQ